MFGRRFRRTECRRRPRAISARASSLLRASMADTRGNPLARLLGWLERLASRPLGAVLLFGLGLGVFAVRAIAWPLKTGRDLDEYLYAYVQLFDHDVLLPWSMLFRTPVTPIVAGLSLDVAGGALAEPIAAVLFAASVVAWSAAGLFFGPRVALATAAALLVYPGYGLMFHELASETVFAAAFAGWALLVTRAATTPTVASLRARRPRRGRAGARSTGECRSPRVRGVPALPRGIVEKSPALGRSRRAGRRPSPGRLDRAQRVAVRHVGPRPRRECDRALLPRVHHRSHRLA